MLKFTEIISKNKKDIIIPSAVLLIICIVIPLALALTNSITADRISELEIKTQNEAMAKLIKADEFEEKNLENNSKYYIAKSGEEALGYIFINSEKGYGGDVSVMTAVNPNGTVKSVAILDVSNETPGLGQNAAKESFYTQYEGKENGVSLLKNGADSSRNEVNAITGATITSTAVNRAVNRALDDFKTLNISEGEEQNGEK